MRGGRAEYFAVINGIQQNKPVIRYQESMSCKDYAKIIGKFGNVTGGHGIASLRM